MFVPYHSVKGGWTVTVPEGWSRTTTGTTVTFTDKLNTVQVDARPGSPVALAGAKKTDVPALSNSALACYRRGIGSQAVFVNLGRVRFCAYAMVNDALRIHSNQAT